MDRMKLFFIIILVIFVIMIWCYSWKLTLMYNSSLLSFYTPDSFPVSEEHEDDHERITDQGESYAKTQTLVIATMVRDVADRLPVIIKKAERVGKLFRDYAVLVVENDSKDGTREKLLEWAKRNPKVKILGCGINAKTCSLQFPKTDGHGVDRRRIDKMAKLRNIYLDEIKQHYTKWNYVAIWDLDAIGVVYLDGIHNTMGQFKENSDVVAICANGVYRWLGMLKLYYDTYATEELDYNFHIDMKTAHDVYTGITSQFDRGEPLQEVKSCFSGFTIYRTTALVKEGVKYRLTPEEEGNLLCEHTELNHTITGKKMINPSMIYLVLLND